MRLLPIAGSMVPVVLRLRRDLDHSRQAVKGKEAIREWADVNYYFSITRCYRTTLGWDALGRGGSTWDANRTGGAYRLNVSGRRKEEDSRNDRDNRDNRHRPDTQQCDGD
jgi:hypothetical protein